MARSTPRKGVGPNPNTAPVDRLARQEPVLREVRELLAGSRGLPHRLRRLERMERTARRSSARVWVNGRALGPKPTPSHLYESYD